MGKRGFAMIMAMIFLVVFASLSVAMLSASSSNVQLADNHKKINSAFTAANSGIEIAKYLASTCPASGQSSDADINSTEADDAWGIFSTHILDAVTMSSSLTLNSVDGNSVVIDCDDIGQDNESFTLTFSHLLGEPNVTVISQGSDGQVKKAVAMNFRIQRDSSVLKYAIASRGRMWITGDSTIHGDVFSTWDRPEISPFNMTSDSCVEGTINTVLTRDQIEADHGSYDNYQLETLDANGIPIDGNGVPLGTNYEDRYYGPDDEIQGYHEGINYEVQESDMPGMDIDDYSTTDYYDWVMNHGNGNIPYTSNVTVEYFPHADGDYSSPKSGSSRYLERRTYDNQIFTDVRVRDNYNALFRNCTFEGILYIDCYRSASSYYNNIRFEDCTFNGTIITDVPQYLKWQHNCLYFTGTATFNNNSGVEEATILAPHFNVNLGNTNPEHSDNNILRGAIVGGIVDVRGNANIYGTIISMCDTTQWSSGYVTNIGATLDDGGSETTSLGDIGTIEIEPDQDKMLPAGINTDIIIVPKQSSYTIM